MAVTANATIMYGGCSTTECYQDTWSYDTTAGAWTAIPSNAGPPFAPGAAFASDPSGVLVAFGKSETWELGVPGPTQGGPVGNPPTSDYLIPFALVTAGPTGAPCVPDAGLSARLRRPR